MHILDSRLLNRAVNVVVVGAGGTGSHLITDLAVWHQTLLDLGHPRGLSVTVIDSDTVSEANVGRARFYPTDVGLSKARTLVHRVNMSLGLNFKAEHRSVSEEYDPDIEEADLVCSCVDTRESRRQILKAMERSSAMRGRCAYFLDTGNRAYDGQAILGQVGHVGKNAQRLPHVLDLYPEMKDSSKDEADAGPSCSRAEALTKQSAYVNKSAALHAINLLSQLWREGRLAYHAVFFSLTTGRTTSLAVDPEAWARFGYEVPEKVALTAVA